MKTPKLLTAIVAIFLFSSLTFASNANVVSNDSTTTNLSTNQQKTDSTALVQNSTSISLPTQQQLDEITTPMLNALDNDVTLTGAQKKSLKKKAEEYAANLVKARAMSNKEESYVFMKAVTDNYQAATDGNLTPDQKVKKEKKKKDRIDQIIKDANSKK